MPLQEIDIHESLQEEFLPYAGESLINFLPTIDGLLPVHKKVLISMLRNKRTHENTYTKTIKVMGEIVTYYVFGDMPLYSSMVNMANNSMNTPLIDGKGSWGDKMRVDGVPASQRYTSCKITKYAEDMLSNLNKGVVPMKPNYDNTTDEMIVAPTMLPNILLNTSQSIAISEASKIPAHNVIDTCDSIISYIADRDIEKSIDIIKCPDLSSGGQIVDDKDAFANIYKTGRGSFSIIGKYRYNDSENKIEVYELPYETTIEAVEDKIRNGYDKGNFKEMTDIRNATGRQGIQLDIYLKRGVDVVNFVSKLRRFTPFESKMSCNFTVLDLDWKTPKLMSLEDIYTRWIKHRFNCITNEFNFDIEKMSKKLHELNGLEKVLLDIDGVVKIVKETKSDNKVVNNLMNYLEIDKEQANYVADIRLRNFNKEYITKKTKEIKELEDSIQGLHYKLSEPNEIKKIIIEQLEYAKKTYGQPRKSIIINQDDLPTFEAEVIQIEDYNVKIFLTEQNYLKKIPLTSLRGNSSMKVKDGDKIISEFDTSNDSDIIIFTSKHNAYKYKSYELTDSKPSLLGEYLPTLLGLDENEEILFTTVTKDYSGELLIGFEDGKFAKINMEDAYWTKQNRKLLKNAFSDKNKAIYFNHIHDDINILAISSINKALVFNSSMINSKSSKSTQGSIAVKSKKDSIVQSYYTLEPNEQNETIDYYKTSNAGVGKYLREGDFNNIINTEQNKK